MRKNLILLALVAVALYSLSCKSSKNAKSDDIWTLKYSRGACFGRCPVFTMELNNFGQIKFKGDFNVPFQGLDSIYLTDNQMATARQLLKTADLTRKVNIVDDKISDLPLTRVAYTVNAAEYNLKYNLTPQPEVAKLLTFLDSVAIRQRWLYEPRSDEKTRARYDEMNNESKMNSFLVKVVLKNKNNIQQVIEKYAECCGLALMQTGSENNKRYYIIRAQTFSLNKEQILKNISGESVVKSAAFFAKGTEKK